MGTPTQPRVETPLVPAWRNKEVIGLLDTSGSMEWPTADGGTVSRHSLLAEALPLFVKALEDQDSAAAGEQASGSDELGGLLLHGFADVHTELGDFNSSNFDRRWNAIRWGGRTLIMPAWKAALADFNEEFGDETEPPVLMTLVVTDGEPQDAEQFVPVLENSGPDRYFAVAVMGYGEEHDKTMRLYSAAEAKNPKHVRIISFDSATNPLDVANALIVLAGLTS